MKCFVFWLFEFEKKKNNNKNTTMNTVTKLLPSSYDVLTPNMSMVVTHDVETASGTVSMVVVLDVQAAMVNALKIKTMLWTLQLQKKDFCRDYLIH